MSAPKSLRLATLTWPIFVENLLLALMGLFGLWLTARISTGAVATFGLVAQVVGGLQIIFRVVSIGTSVVATQHQGAGDAAGAQAVARTGLAASVCVGLVTLLLMAAGGGWLLHAMHLPGELMPLGEPYARVLGVALLLDCVAMTMVAVLRAYTHTRSSMHIVLLMNLLQLLASVPLMLGVGGWEGAGLVGLALAMALSRLLGLALGWRAWRSLLGIELRWRDLLAMPREPLRAILRIGLPGGGEKVAFRVAFLFSIALVADMGPAALAAHAFVFQAVQLVTLFANSVAAALEIMLGHHIGAGTLRAANRLLWRALALSVVVTLAGTALSWWLTPLAVAAGGADVAVLGLLGTVLLLEFVLEPGRVCNLIVTAGLRASGDARFAAQASAAFNFAFGAGLAWLLGVHAGLGLAGVWMAYLADECGRGLAMCARWYWLGWAGGARRTRSRILGQLRGRRGSGEAGASGIMHDSER